MEAIWTACIDLVLEGEDEANLKLNIDVQAHVVHLMAEHFEDEGRVLSAIFNRKYFNESTVRKLCKMNIIKSIA